MKIEPCAPHLFATSRAPVLRIPGWKVLTAFVITACSAVAIAQIHGTNFLDHDRFARRAYGNDALWYERNIPFLDIDNPDIQRVYYYRWQLYKAHLRDVGQPGFVVTEFLDRVPWDRQPWDTIDDSAAFHIEEGRWLRDRRYMDDEIAYMYNDGGDNRQYSEWVTAATYDRMLVTGDPASATQYLPAMKKIFDAWDDHFDHSRGLYWIEPLFDATEYSIASIDASGGLDGFTGGEAYRPSINSYMFASAMAISHLASLDGDGATAARYLARAGALRAAITSDLWNDRLQHFTDRYEITNQYVRAWDFIRGRELVGYLPWYLNVVGNDPRYNIAWAHLLAPDELGGPRGIRTVEPSYQYFMRQYRYDPKTGRPECQWNGPTWPFEVTQALVGIANLLNDSHNDSNRDETPIVSTDNYLRLLEQYTRIHSTGGHLDLQEDYNAQTGEPIVGLPRSHHYNHSEYADLIITGLAGLRPREDNTLEVNPLLPRRTDDPNFIRYFCLEDIPYHGHLVTILYDADGRRYRSGAGLSIYVDGQRMAYARALGRLTVTLHSGKQAHVSHHSSQPVDLAVNVVGSGFPLPASSNRADSSSLYSAIDGRIWFFPEVANGWSTAIPSGTQPASQEWYSVDFGRPEQIGSAEIFFFADGKQFAAPGSISLQYWTSHGWGAVDTGQTHPLPPIANGPNSFAWKPVTSTKFRVVLRRAASGAASRLIELKLFALRSQGAAQFPSRH